LEPYLWECALGENTAERLVEPTSLDNPRRAEHSDDGWDDGYLHQQARLTAGTIAYNDKLSTDFRHLDRGVMGGEGGESDWLKKNAGR
jgi:hypothetical protein